MIVPSQLALKTHTNLGCAASFATLDKLYNVLISETPCIVDKFTLPPAALPIGDVSLTHVIKLAAHSTTSPTPTAIYNDPVVRHENIIEPHNFTGLLIYVLFHFVFNTNSIFEFRLSESQNDVYRKSYDSSCYI
jgi:hypothetical protein